MVGDDAPVVLVVEDDDGDALLVEELLFDALPDATMRRARSVAEAEQAITADVACALLDLGLPDSEHTEGVTRLRSAAPHVAIVVLTAANDEKLGISAVAAGAQDYLVKGEVDDRVLLRSLRYAIERQHNEATALRLFEAEARRAENERMERALLPRPVLRRDDVALHVEYRPGNAGAQLGGDFYDAVEMADGRVRVVIGDVAGHGPDEAALGATLRGAWRALVLADLPAGEVLRVLDAQIRTETELPHVFATACMIDVAPDARRAGVVVAGHPPPFVLASDGTPTPTHAIPGGPLLGVVPGATWPTTTLDLPERWTVLLFTDGLFEGRAGAGTADRLGEDGARALVEARVQAGEAGPQLLAGVVADVEERNGGPLTDDVAACLIAGRWAS